MDDHILAALRTFLQILELFCVKGIDVATPMFDGQEKPPRDLFVEDGLHPTANCYAMWTFIIRPVLLQRFSNAKHVAENRVFPSPFRSGAESAMPSAH